MIEGAGEPTLWERLVPPGERDGFPVMAGHLPGLGHALTLHADAVGAMRRAERDLGPCVYFSLGFGQWLLLCLGEEGFEVCKHRSLAVGGARSNLGYLLGDSVMTVDGDEHRRLRSSMNPTFSARGLAESGAGRVSAETVREHVRAMVD